MVTNEPTETTDECEYVPTLIERIAEAIPTELTATAAVGIGGARRLKIARAVLPVVEAELELIRAATLSAVCEAEGHRTQEITTFGKLRREFLCGRCAHRWTEPHPGGTP